MRGSQSCEDTENSKHVHTDLFKALFDAKGPTYKPLSSSNCQACICRCHLVRIPQCRILMG